MVDSSGNNPIDNKPKTPSDAIPGLPTGLPAGMQKAYPANKAPAIQAWFKKNFPNMTQAQVDKAVSQFMQIEMQFLANIQKKLQAKQKEAADKLKKSIEGNG